MSDKKPKHLKYWLGVFGLLFSTLTLGVFLIELETTGSLLLASGYALLVVALCFTFAFVIYGLSELDNDC